jgi:hypothetical protein
MLYDWTTRSGRGRVRIKFEMSAHEGSGVTDTINNVRGSSAIPSIVRRKASGEDACVRAHGSSGQRRGKKKTEFFIESLQRQGGRCIHTVILYNVCVY